MGYSACIYALFIGRRLVTGTMAIKWGALSLLVVGNINNGPKAHDWFRDQWHRRFTREMQKIVNTLVIQEVQAAESETIKSKQSRKVTEEQRPQAKEERVQLRPNVIKNAEAKAISLKYMLDSAKIRLCCSESFTMCQPM